MPTSMAESGDAVFLHFADSYRFHMYGSEFATTLAHTQQAEQAAGHHVAVLHSGDAFFSCGLCNRGNGSHIPDIFRFLKVDFMCPGNHEMDQGLLQFRDIIRLMNTRIVLSNVRPVGEAIYPWWAHPDSDTSHTLVHPDAHFVRGAWHVRIIGLWDASTLDACGIDIRNELAIMEDPITAALRLCNEWRHSPFEWMRVCICLTHMDLETDLRLAHSGACDYILGGHDHFWFSNEPLRLVKSGTDMHDLAVVRVGKKRESEHSEHSVQPDSPESLESAHPDQQTEPAQQELQNGVTPLLNLPAVVHSTADNRRDRDVPETQMLRDHFTDVTNLYNGPVCGWTSNEIMKAPRNYQTENEYVTKLGDSAGVRPNADNRRDREETLEQPKQPQSPESVSLSPNKPASKLTRDHNVLTWSLTRITRDEMTTCGADEAFRALVDTQMGHADMRPICQLKESMPVTTLRNRLAQTYPGQWVAKQLHEATLETHGTQAGVVNSGYIRAENDLHHGRFTYAILEELMPFNDEVMAISCSIPTLAILLERHTRGLPDVENGHYPQIHGLYIQVNVRHSPRIVSLWLRMPHDTILRLDGPHAMRHIRLGIRTFDHGYLFQGCTLVESEMNGSPLVHSILLRALGDVCPFYSPYTTEEVITLV